MPDFIIGGAPRCGTVFMCNALDSHPDVFIAKPYTPEPKVFMGPIKSANEYYAQYEGFFADAKEGAVLGEKTTYYLESADACRLIKAHLPDVKLLFMVREPVSRAYSNYLWSRKNNIETLSFEEAIELEGKRDDPFPAGRSYVKPFNYLTRSGYADFAQTYLDAFGPRQVAFFLYEDIVSDPDKLMKKVQEYIGVSPVGFRNDGLGIVNAARYDGPSINPDTERRLRERFAPMVRRFRDLTGMDVKVWGYDE